MAGVVVLWLAFSAMAGCIDDDATKEGPGAAAGGPGLVETDPNEDVLVLAPGDHAFWDVADIEGRYDTMEPQPGGDPRRACPPNGDVECVEYVLELEEGGERLRVAMDQDDPSDDYRVGLYAPGGDLVAWGWIGWSIELFAHDPEPGKWTVLVSADAVDDGSARMRAKLEAAPVPDAEGAERGTGQGAAALLPNLRPVVPFDLRFKGIHMGPAGSAPMVSCHVDEMVEDGAQRCLRFAFGYGNIGDGPFEVLFEPVEDGMTEGGVQQRVHHADGSTRLRDAGTYEYHPTHGHYHYDGILSADLYRITDVESGAGEPLVEAAKRGACAHDWRIAHWHAFIADPQYTHDSGDECNVGPGGTSPTGARIGLSRGWSDIYGAGLQDNYVEASGVGDGQYLLRVEIDAGRSVAETNETDNIGYTYFEVSGDDVGILERGLGLGPWDPVRIVTTEWVP